jgi:hypothetical protein
MIDQKECVTDREHFYVSFILERVFELDGTWNLVSVKISVYS